MFDLRMVAPVIVIQMQMIMIKIMCFTILLEG